MQPDLTYSLGIFKTIFCFFKRFVLFTMKNAVEQELLKLY